MPLNKVSQGDIILLPFPFTDLAAEAKRRPAVVISNQAVNKTQDVILAAITSNLRNDEFSLKINNADVTHALPAPSEIRCDKLFTASKHIIVRKMSALNKKQQKVLFDKISELLKVS
jgi:mRNA interferase MazF